MDHLSGHPVLKDSGTVGTWAEQLLHAFSHGATKGGNGGERGTEAETENADSRKLHWNVQVQYRTGTEVNSELGSS